MALVELGSSTHNVLVGRSVVGSEELLPHRISGPSGHSRRWSSSFVCMAIGLRCFKGDMKVGSMPTQSVG